MSRGGGRTFNKANAINYSNDNLSAHEKSRLAVVESVPVQAPTVEKNNTDLSSTSKKQPLVRNPSLTHPWGKNPEGRESGLVWIHINGRRIISQQSKGVGTVTVPVGKPDVQFAFLAPLVITETNAHNWGEYDSLASRLAQKVRTAAKVGAEWTALVITFKTATIEDTAKNRIASGKNQGQLISNWMHDLYSRVSSYSIPKLKVDTPLYYESSDRRSLNFEVMLVAEKNPKADIIDPVHDLMKFAAPNLKGGGISIDFPYMFSVETSPASWIKYTTLALTAVQPSWNHPYIGGYPSSCNLQLTFKDMSPLYRGAIEEGSVINVIPAGESDRKRAAGEAEPPTPTTLTVAKSKKVSRAFADSIAVDYQVMG